MKRNFLLFLLSAASILFLVWVAFDGKCPYRSTDGLMKHGTETNSASGRAYDKHAPSNAHTMHEFGRSFRRALGILDDTSLIVEARVLHSVEIQENEYLRRKAYYLRKNLPPMIDYDLAVLRILLNTERIDVIQEQSIFRIPAECRLIDDDVVLIFFSNDTDMSEELFVPIYENTSTDLGCIVGRFSIEENKVIYGDYGEELINLIVSGKSNAIERLMLDERRVLAEYFPSMISAFYISNESDTK